MNAEIIVLAANGRMTQLENAIAVMKHFTLYTKAQNAQNVLGVPEIVITFQEVRVVWQPAQQEKG